MNLFPWDRMIAIFDEDGGGDVDFQEFVTGLSAFSSKGNKEEKLRFAFRVYDIDRDGYISNGELFIVLKMMVGNNLKDVQLQQIVDKTIMEADKDGDGKISFEEFTQMVESTDVNLSMTLSTYLVPRFFRHVCCFSLKANPLPQTQYNSVQAHLRDKNHLRILSVLSVPFVCLVLWSFISPFRLSPVRPLMFFFCFFFFFQSHAEAAILNIASLNFKDDTTLDDS